MAVVRFAFGKRPTSIPGREAAALADLFYLRPTAESYHLANKFRHQADRDDTARA
jgi:hypothetical protein